VTFGWHLLRDHELCIEGRHTVIHVDTDGHPTPWPPALRSGLGLD
jgi:acyl-CoA thioesterase FadM